MDDQREHFLRKFRQMDTDQSGVLSKKEVKSCLMVSGFDKTFVKKFLKKFDADGDGNITEEEYLRVVGIIPHEERRMAVWKSVFEDVDKDKSGRISCVELYNLLKEMGIIVQLNELKEWVRKHDKDKDGEMDIHEFMAFMSSSGT